MSTAGFDIDSAWLRRFSADASANLGAFAHRLKEALPDRVTLEQKRGFFGRRGDVTGVEITLGDNRYRVALDGSRLLLTIAMVVRGVTLNTRQVDAETWFARLSDETRAASGDAQALSRLLAGFMAS